ncbi:DUF624 domain-containing protein [Isoptericola variabilis]|uniref:Glycosyltransferase 36 n=1 Tax=Isoptericola variabilis (strain 225) TaxID=743718 RepID=F6FU62_ISOV2|nr:DUF624 domain-containing protein [Isoptericola variabilis]AEG43258.1 glycosyltransferase 36 [Isoptericola variabilis 225]TWH35193.1 uncharacterized protein DUF624 [Isoptericola variabilis J7]
MSTDHRGDAPRGSWPEDPPTTPASVGGRARPAGDLGEGPLGRITGTVYWFLIVGLLLVLSSLPSMVLLVLLDRASSNALLVPLCLVPAGPALSAALYALRDRGRAESLTPGRSFWKGYRLNALDVLRLWTPAMLVLGVIAFSVVNIGQVGVPRAYAVVLLVIGAGILLWALQALTIVSFYTFRARDVARLAIYYLVRLPLVTLGVLSLLVVAAAVVWLTSEGVLALFSVIWVWFLLNNARPLLRDVEQRFVAH